MKIEKKIFDFFLALILLFISVGLIVLLILISSIDTSSFGLFTQKRVGKDTKIFKIFKIRTMRGEHDSSITTQNTHQITKLGRFLRKYKLDELPQLLNVLLGQMSFVGPRPDVEGYADQLKNEDRIIIKVKPGITGPAQLKYRNEEELLAQQSNPQLYNDEVIWPDKVAINKEYVKKWKFSKDLYYLYKTIF